MEPSKDLQFIEFFAGRARLTRLARSLGIPSEAHDLAFDKEAIESGDRNSMDITSTAGYLYLSPKQIGFLANHTSKLLPVFVLVSRIQY